MAYLDLVDMSETICVFPISLIYLLSQLINCHADPLGEIFL